MRVGIIGHPKKIKNVLEALENRKDLYEIETMPLIRTGLKDVEKVEAFQKKVDFIIFCGIYDYMYFLKKIEFEKIAGYIKNDLTALYITLLALSMRGIDLEDISIDGYSPMDLDYICDELGINKTQVFKGSYNRVEIVDDTDVLMEEMSVFHKNLFFSKKVKVCVTCMSPVYEKLKSQGVDCILVRNTYESICSEYENIKYKYLLKQKEQTNILAIEIKIISNVYDNIMTDEIDVMRENAEIIEKLLLFSKRINASMDLVSNNHYIIFTELGSMEKETDSYTNFSVFYDIKSNSNSRLNVGIGFGKNPFEIRRNARKAYLYATKEDKSCIYICYDSSNIKGPVELTPKEKNDDFEINEYCDKIAVSVGLSSNTVYRMASIYKQTKGKSYTINELAEIYGTSVKNMYSIISKLEEKGYILDSGKKLHNNSGRPSRFIRLNFFN